MAERSTANKLGALCEKHPELFINPPFGIKRPNNYTGPLHYFSCDDGWSEILDVFCHLVKHELSRWRENKKIKDRLAAAGDETPEWLVAYFKDNPDDPLDTFRFDQIKEKFGGLRIYWNGPNFCSPTGSYIRALVCFAEAMSFRTCEYCGTNQNVATRGRGYIQTLCASCEEAQRIERDLRRLEEAERRAERLYEETRELREKLKELSRWEDEWKKQKEEKEQAAPSSTNESSEEDPPSIQG